MKRVRIIVLKTTAKGDIPPHNAKEFIDKIIDEIIEYKEPILNGELVTVNTTLLSLNVLQYGKIDGADIAKLPL